MGAAVEDPHVGGRHILAIAIGVGVSAEDVDFGAHGGGCRSNQRGLDGDRRDWSVLEEAVVGWVRVSVDGEPVDMAVASGSDIEVADALGAVEKGSDGEEVWGGDG